MLSLKTALKETDIETVRVSQSEDELDGLLVSALKSAQYSPIVTCRSHSALQKFKCPPLKIGKE